MILPEAVKIEGLPDLIKKCNNKRPLKQLSVEIQKMYSNGEQYFNIVYFGETSKIDRKKEQEFLLSILSMKAKKSLRGQKWLQVVQDLGSQKFLYFMRLAEQSYYRTPEAFLKRFLELTKIIYKQQHQNTSSMITESKLDCEETLKQKLKKYSYH